MPDWIDISDYSPDWKHGGAAELLMKDGTIVSGELWMDAAWGGDCEIPMPVFQRDGDRAEISIWDAESIRFIETE